MNLQKKLVKESLKSHLSLLHYFFNDYDLNFTASEELQQFIITNLKIKECHANQPILSTGEMANEVYFIKTKRKRSVTVINEALDMRVADLKLGSYFGEASILFGLESAYTFLALTNSRIYYIEKDTLLEALEMYPSFASFLRHRSSVRLSYWSCIEIGYQKFMRDATHEF